ELIKDGLEKDSKVMISGFGVFEVKDKHARPGRNPQTGDKITLSARKVVKFKASQILRRELNESVQQTAPATEGN
ncbi:MAG TPA: HU family DNA-binding protein, partial [Oligoflexia bacterium]|nr:HU family DNA-binding protein [Oligoflexia bacterium]